MSTEIRIQYNHEHLFGNIDAEDAEAEGISVEASLAKYNRRLRYELMQAFGNDVDVDIRDGLLHEIQVDWRRDTLDCQTVAHIMDQLSNNDEWIVYETELA